MRKINWKRFWVLGYWLLVIGGIGLLVYSRFVGLNWGFPYPIHPDERNMANAVQQLTCQFSVFNFQFSKLFSNFYQQLSNCYNPHFFAYGQFPLYLAYSGIQIYHFIFKLPSVILFEEATMALRIISAVASILSVITVIKIITVILESNSSTKKPRLSTIYYLVSAFLLIFSPYAVQLSHFGTTESLLMLFYSLIIYFSLKVMEKWRNGVMIKLAVVAGLALATKISSGLFLAVPLFVLVKYTFFTRLGKPAEGGGTHWSDKKWVRIIILIAMFLSISTVISIIFSPHNLISFSDFLGSIKYESEVALGHYVTFYTRQFVMTVPIWFQLTKIFPYALGWLQYILAILGFIFLPWRIKRINILRLAFLIYFLPTSFFFAKWTRFMAPIFPIMSIFAVLFFYEFSISNFKFLIKSKFQILKYLFFLLSIIYFLSSIIPGLAYLSIYQQPDIHFTVSNWIYKNIPNNAYILSETANVIDLPVQGNIEQGNNVTMKQLNNYRYISFNFYDLDSDPQLQKELQQHIFNADYIFVPSRRIFANETCLNPNFQFSIFNFQSIINNQFLNVQKRCNYLKKQYPLLNSYYDKLFSGKLGFQEVAEFASYPKICIPLLHATCYTLQDEGAEESWTIFDHPVFRIYKRTNSKFSISNFKSNLNF